MWEEVYQKHYPELLRYACGACRDKEAAEDLAQEVFLRALQNADLFEDLGPSQKRAWLFRCLKNLMCDRYRRSMLEAQYTYEKGGELPLLFCYGSRLSSSNSGDQFRMSVWLYESPSRWVNFFRKEAFTMVKGVSRQVIVVHNPETKLFEQAIFILKDEAVEKGVTDEALLKEAQQAIHSPEKAGKKRYLRYYGPVWACGGAALTGLVWLVTALL